MFQISNRDINQHHGPKPDSLLSLKALVPPSPLIRLSEPLHSNIRTGPRENVYTWTQHIFTRRISSCAVSQHVANFSLAPSTSHLTTPKCLWVTSPFSSSDSLSDLSLAHVALSWPGDQKSGAPAASVCLRQHHIRCQATLEHQETAICYDEPVCGNLVLQRLLPPNLPRSPFRSSQWAREMSESRTLLTLSR